MKKSIILFALAIGAIASAEAQAPQDAAKGVFSVSESKQVYFSQGNLYYLRNQKEWYFHPEQYEVCTVTDFATDNGIDLFGWSADNTTAPYGISTSQKNADYAGDFVDWGTLPIGGEGAQAGVWRTPTADEWTYLFNRKHNGAFLFGHAKVHNRIGVVLLPDVFSLPDGLTWNPDQALTEDDWSKNVYDLDQWHKMEDAGAVFLPVYGYRSGTRLISPTAGSSMNWKSYYWSSTSSDPEKADAFCVADGKTGLVNGDARVVGNCVRLVQDIAPSADVWEMSVDEDCTLNGKSLGITPMPDNVQVVDLGLSVAWASYNVGASRPEEYGNYYAWGEVLTKEDYSWDTYRYANGKDKLTKYCSNAALGNEGFTDSKTVLEPADDAAYTNWGSAWRMPTKAEWDELTTNCTWTAATQDGVTGYKVESEDTGESIFLPAAGCFFGTDTQSVNANNHYWSSELNTEKPSAAWLLYTEVSEDGLYVVANDTREQGMSVRPVCANSARPKSSYCTLTVNAGECGKPNRMRCHAGQQVRITAASSYKERVFVRWSDGSIDNPRLVTVMADMTLTAEFGDKGTGILSPSSDDDNTSATTVRKIIRNGQVLIERNGKTYTLTGVEVK